VRRCAQDDESVGELTEGKHFSHEEKPGLASQPRLYLSQIQLLKGE
jgi:hypothetical protein